MYVVNISDSRARTYSYREDERRVRWTEFVTIQDTTADHELVILQYVWNKYGYTQEHFAYCRNCDPREGCISGNCNLQVEYQQVPEIGTPIDGTGAPAGGLPRDWPSLDRPASLLGGGRLSYGASAPPTAVLRGLRWGFGAPTAD